MKEVYDNCIDYHLKEMYSIPKVIHYFWFGKNPKPEIVIKCIESWKKKMPDWEIKEWNEDNYDVHCCEYVESAYSMKKWAFVSDYARFDILNKYGGIYLDTDVELLKTIPISFLNNPFTAVDSNGLVAPGLILALPSQHWLSKKVLDSFCDEKFTECKMNSDITINTRVNKIIKEMGYMDKDMYQKIDDLFVYPSEYFCGYDVNIHEYNITPKTISVHHYASSWMSEKQLKKRKYQAIIKKIIGVKGYKKLIKIKRNIIGVSKE